MTGKVWLVGAGPSDPGLFTLKGKSVLKQAQVVVYDALVGQGILNMIPQEAEKIHVGKRANHHTMPQEEINRVLAEKAMEGLRVVRLKGGDPFLFGRGGEELEYLLQRRIPCEVVPGVTSAIAVPAYNGIPVTHRDYCSSVHIITGHKKQGENYDIDFEALVKTRGTLVFLMGVSALGEICKGLMEKGMDGQMPAAILQKGTTASQKRIVATVSTLEEAVKREGIETPAIIVVGKVCALADSFAWYEKLPLAGKKILVTRPRQQISAMAEKLRRLGAEVLELPAIRTESITPNPGLNEAFGRLSSYDWLVFTSPTGVQVFWTELRNAGLDVRSLAGAKLAVIGKGTKKALEKRGLLADLMPETYSGEALGEALSREVKPGERILIPRARIGNQKLVDCLNATGKVTVDDVATYDTFYETPSLIDERAEFEQGTVDFAVFTSASTVRGFVQAVPGINFTKVRAVCIGEQTQREAAAHGMKTYVSDQATMDSIVRKLCEICSRTEENRKKEKS